MITECLDDYCRTLEPIVTGYVGKKYDSLDHPINDVTGADLKILLDELQSLLAREQQKYQE